MRSTSACTFMAIALVFVLLSIQSAGATQTEANRLEILKLMGVKNTQAAVRANSSVKHANTVNPAPTPFAEVTPAVDILYVDGAVSASGNGQSWAGAFKTIGEALDTTPSHPNGCHVWVKKGTYAEGELRIWRNYGLFGGFAGNEAPATFRLSSRNVFADQSIIDATGHGHGIIIAHAATASETSYYIDGVYVLNGDALQHPSAVPEIPGVPETSGGSASPFASRGGGIIAYGQPVIGDTRGIEPPAGSQVPVVWIRNCWVQFCDAQVSGGDAS